MHFFLTETEDNKRRRDEFGLFVVCMLKGCVIYRRSHPTILISGSPQKISELLLTSFCYNIFGQTDVNPRMHCRSTNMATQLELA